MVKGYIMHHIISGAVNALREQANSMDNGEQNLLVPSGRHH